MPGKLRHFIDFLTIDIWKTSPENLSPFRRLQYSVIKRLYLTIQFFTTKRTVDMASALTYSTLLAIVPICAVVFAIARGFGFSSHIEVWFRDALSSQPQAAEAIIGFVNSYLVHAKSGVILGIGLIFMLWTVLMLIRNIEQTFNDIWQVKKKRSIMRTITDYLAMLFLIPVFIVLTSGISLFMAMVAVKTDSILLVGPVVRFGINIMPYLLTVCVFTSLYLFMPNTHVKLKYVIIPGIISGVAMQLVQYVYIHSQIFLSSYNAIYGSFAALPLFMLWVQISWSICLFGAEMSYASQNLEEFSFLAKTSDISHRYKILLSALLLSRICKRFKEGKHPYTAVELKLETGIPTHIIHDLLYTLSEVNLVVANSGLDSSNDTVYQPAEALINITVGSMIDRLESKGVWNLRMELHNKFENETTWQKVLNIRKNYLASMRNIAIVDL